MNDRIRNALQAIECITYAADPSATESVREAVGAIDEVLKEVLSDSTIFPQPPLSIRPANSSTQSPDKTSITAY
jgi:hypothetical protein